MILIAVTLFALMLTASLYFMYLGCKVINRLFKR